MNPKQHKWKVSRAVIKQVSDISNNMYQKYSVKAKEYYHLSAL